MAKKAPYRALEKFVEIFEKEYEIDLSEVRKELKKQTPEEILIPVSIFNSKLGSLETVCKYLKENLKLNYHEIAELLNRNDRTVWATCRNASRKVKKRLVAKEGQTIPISIIANRKLSVLEAIVSHLKQFNLTYREIGVMLKRDERNVWTVHNRAKKKWKKL